MNITITPGAATEDAAQIDAIVSSIEDSMQVLDAAIERNIADEGEDKPDSIQTKWSSELKSNWKTYYGNDVPAAMEDMKQSASNLRLAVDQALKYSGE